MIARALGDASRELDGGGDFLGGSGRVAPAYPLQDEASLERIEERGQEEELEDDTNTTEQSETEMRGDARGDDVIIEYSDHEEEGDAGDHEAQQIEASDAVSAESKELEVERISEVEEAPSSSSPQQSMRRRVLQKNADR